MGKQYQIHKKGKVYDLKEYGQTCCGLTETRLGYQSKSKGCTRPLGDFRGYVYIGDRRVTWKTYRALIAESNKSKSDSTAKL